MKGNKKRPPKSTRGKRPKRAGRAKRDVGKAPHWDSMHRELRVGKSIVKQFKQPAQSQETIIAAFQEEGWPPRMDDPSA